MDPFTTLGLPATFDLDTAQIEQRYRDLSRALHPDRFVGATPSERRLALTRAVEVNEAYRTLRDDLARAKALLALRGHTVTDSQPTDPAFLMEVMELREALAEARASRDLAAVQRLARTVGAERDRARVSLASLFAQNAELSSIADVLAKMRYYRRFLDEVEVIEEEALAASV